MNKEPEGDPRPLIDLYNPPPAFPVESVWAGIEADEGESAAEVRPDPVGRRAVKMPVSWAAAAAIILFVGGAAAGVVLVDPARTHLADTTSEVEPSSAALNFVSSTSDGARQVVWF